MLNEMSLFEDLLYYVTIPMESFPYRGKCKCKVPESKVILQIVTTSEAVQFP